jgi:hypothetical protein
MGSLNGSARTTLEAHLTEVAAEVGAERGSAAGAVEFRRASRLFAAAAGNVVEVKLDPEIAEAALRTPSTNVSPRGADWVRLAADQGEPTQMDLDRARAWFLSAWRAAEK